MSSTFVVSDLETTGLSRRDEILELAAIRVDSSGVILGTFTSLVQIQGRLSRPVRALTGITPAMLRQRGVPLREALPAYLRFCASDPIFFHHAAFDRRFLLEACGRRALAFENPVLCSLKVARAAWPGLRSHTLEALARHTGVQPPTHRGLADVKATLGILLAACPPPA